MQNHLVSFEYGTGSVWGFVTAPSADEILNRLPEVDVAAAPPPWMTEDDVRVLLDRAVAIDQANALDELIRIER